MSNAAILLGAGNSTRMGNTIEDKIVTSILNKPVFAYSIEAFINTKLIETVVIVYKDSNQKKIIEKWVFDNCCVSNLKILWCQGGIKRQDSVLFGLKILPTNIKNVFIHDMARPLVQSSIIKKLYSMLLSKDSATLAHKIVDTVKQIIPGNAQKLNSIDRTTLWAMETPQAFSYPIVLESLTKINSLGIEITDDISAVDKCGYSVEIVENTTPNPKITFKSDLDYVKFLLTECQNYVPV